MQAFSLISRAATLIAGSASRALVPALQRERGRQFSTATIERFPDGEVSVRLEEPVRGEEVILRSARCRWPTGMRRNSIYRWRCATRAVFAPGALGKMAGAGVRSVFVTDTILTV